MDKATSKVKEFIKKVNREYPLSQAIIFGSRSRNDYLEGSDIDLMLVSDSFKNIRFFDRPSLLYEYWDWGCGLPLELLCYTGKEFKKKRGQISIVRTAFKEGSSLLK